MARCPEAAFADLFGGPSQTVDGPQHQPAHGRIDADGGHRQHEQHHEHLLEHAGLHALRVDVHGLDDGHRAADLADAHALLLVAVLVQFPLRVAMAFQAGFRDVQGFQVAEHPLAGLVRLHVVVRLQRGIGCEGLEGALLERVGGVGGLARGLAGEADGVVGLRGEQHAH